jgi:branched-chain amino acid transport system ATP-binding protein
MSVASVDPTGCTAPPLLAAVGLSVAYGGVPVVRELNLEIKRGEVVALLGANGAGKTTTILALCGELQPAEGHVSWLGAKSSSSLAERARAGMALITEERCVLFGLTVAENLRLGRGDPELALELFPPLRDHLNRKVGLLSGGQQQILAVARALAAKPVMLLADELSLGLAPMVTAELLNAVRRASEEQGTGVLIVEQHVRKALAVADRGYVLRRGRCVLEGSSAELTRRIDEIERSYIGGDE